MIRASLVSLSVLLFAPVLAAAAEDLSVLPERSAKDMMHA